MMDQYANPRELYGKPERITTFIRPRLQELIRNQAAIEDTKIARVIEDALLVYFSYIHNSADPSMEFQEGMTHLAYRVIAQSLADSIVDG